MHGARVGGWSLVVSYALLASGCAATEPSSAPGPPTGVAETSASPSPPSPTLWASVPPYEQEKARLGPPEPILGTPYPFDLYVHCTGEFTRFGGRYWQTDAPPGDLRPRPEPDGRTRITGFIAGTMELLDSDTARFVMDTRYVASSQPVVLYRRTPQEPPGCM
jgi:hypothetical protein